jgi:tetratricopeptide (TPR) repeat protein
VALKLLQPRLDALASTPSQDTQGSKDLAQAYRDISNVDEAKDDWPQAVANRAKVVETVASISPKDYSDQPSDLAFAYSLLSWAEIFNNQTEKGITDAETAISLSKTIKGLPSLNGSYENGVKALIVNKKYDAAEKLLDEFSDFLTEPPSTVEKQRELATFVDVRQIEISRETNLLQRVVKYRRDELSTLNALKPDAYTNLKADIVSAYGDLSDEESKAGDFDQGLIDAQTAINLDDQPWIEENKANALLFTHHPDQALEIYKNVKDKLWQGDPISKAISDDFLAFCKLGHTTPEMGSIAQQLKIDNPDLTTCLKSPPKPTPAK